MKRFRFWPLLAIALFVLLACRVDMHTTFDTPTSGKVEVSWTMTADEEHTLQSAAGQSAKEICDQMREQMTSDDPTAQVTFESKGDKRTCTATGKFTSIAELSDFYGDDTTINKIGEENGKFYYDVTTSPTSNVGDIGIPIQVTWTVTMPGKVIEHNGDELHGRTVVWHLSGTEKVHMKAVSKTGGFSLDSKTIAIGLVCLCLPLLLIIIGVIAWLVLRKRKQNNQPPQAPTAADWDA